VKGRLGDARRYPSVADPNLDGVVDGGWWGHIGHSNAFVEDRRDVARGHQSRAAAPGANLMTVSRDPTVFQDESGEES
jgi:hypothetical protein